MWTAMAQPADSWTLTGAIFQGYLKGLDRLSIRAAVRERVSPATRSVMDKPPLVVSAASGAMLDEMMVALAALRGPRAPREIAAAVMVDSLGAVLQRLLAATLKLFGNSPRTIFERLGTLSAPMIRGVDFEYQAVDDTRGVVTLSFPAPVSEAYQGAWEGTLEYAYLLCGIKGTARARPRRSPTTVEIEVQWAPPGERAT
jgi:hypothetical protein